MHLVVFVEPDGKWLCDAMDISGSPPIGRGYNKYEAVGSFLLALRHDQRIQRCLTPGLSVTEVTTEFAKECKFRGDLIGEALGHPWRSDPTYTG